MSDKANKSNPSSPHQDHHIQEGWLDSQIGKPILCKIADGVAVGFLLDFDKFTLLLKPAMAGEHGPVADLDKPEFLMFKQSIISIQPVR